MSSVYQHVINVVVSIPISSGPAVLMEFSVGKDRDLIKYNFFSKIYNLTPLSLLS